MTIETINWTGWMLVPIIATSTTQPKLTMDMTKFRLAQEAWDYRAEPEPTDIDALESWTDAVIATIGRACRVAREGDWIAARDLLMSAARDLAESPMPDEA